ncbi:hypothetical protein ACFWXI_32800, partial [[Kitasatospora] papulosa]|uniref:hypothetical protein n=1 Tax=[Kitasatospora] papulosa TaxID=1464011 RepID=UPI0036CF6EA7
WTPSSPPPSDLVVDEVGYQPLECAETNLVFFETSTSGGAGVAGVCLTGSAGLNRYAVPGAHEGGSEVGG